MSDPPPLARFVALHEAAENPVSAGDTPFARLRFAVMIARSVAGVVLVFNRYRKVWELPGGLLDAGDSPRDCAIRELHEEAGCRAGHTDWLGVVEVSDGRTHFGGVFSCTVDEVPDIFESDETAGIAYWTPSRAPHPLGHTDEALLRRFGVRDSVPDAARLE